MTRTDNPFYIVVNVAQQQLSLFDGKKCIKHYSIASARNGVGELNGSEQTPRGKHFIRAKIGYDKPINTVFVGRRDTGELFSESLREQYPDRDWILTRILWLCGSEPGFNRGGNVDTMRRYVYIHGAPDTDAMGLPSSHGCIKMRNDDVIELFDKAPTGTPVTIVEES
ncbi:MAG: L,D-transpeptidase [Proteobacteria bacterium]|nr:L,D-transpeptidase [Pseudomonadota bacterium]